MTAYRNSEVAHNFTSCTLVERVERILSPQIYPQNPREKKTIPKPDPAVAPDAGQFIRISLLDYTEQCSEENCYQETRIEVLTHPDGDSFPFCVAHVHVIFADWMVGA